MGAIFNGLGSLTGQRSSQPGPGSFQYAPPYPGAGQPIGSPTLPNGAWDDGPTNYYGPTGPGYGLKEGETMTVSPKAPANTDPGADLKPQQKFMMKLGNFEQGKGFTTNPDPNPEVATKMTFVGTKDPFAPKAYMEGQPGFVDYSQGMKKDADGHTYAIPGGTAYTKDGSINQDAFVTFPSSAYGYKGSAFGYSWDAQQGQQLLSRPGVPGQQPTPPLAPLSQRATVTPQNGSLIMQFLDKPQGAAPNAPTGSLMSGAPATP